jgi:hypothetical protein
MQPNHLRTLVCIEMALDRIPYGHPQVLKAIGLGKDRR